MNILIIVPRYNLTNKKDYDYVFPLGLGYISAVIKKAGFSVDCLNLNHYDGEIENLIKSQTNQKVYDVIGTGGNALIYSILERIINTSKKYSSTSKIILGGPMITTEPEIIFQALKPDFGVLGEGEETIVELLKSIEYKKDFKKIKGIIYYDNGLIITPKREPITDLDSLPYPDFEGLGFSEQLENMHTNYTYHWNLFDNPRIYPLLGSRSCPFQCTFCYHESRYRRRSQKSIMDELKKMIKKYKINIITIYDECFSVEKKSLEKFCKFLKDLKKEISWDLKWTCQLRVETVDDEILKMMKEAGCEAISYGFESFSPTVLQSMKKNITPEQIDRAFKSTLKNNISIQANFIFGDVAETIETSKLTLDYWKDNSQGQIGLGFIQPYPGSQIHKLCIEKGIIKDKLEFIKSLSNDNWFNMTGSMADKEIKDLKNKILDYTSKYNKFVMPKKLTKEKDYVYSLEVICPFCNSDIEYKNCLIKSPLSFGFFMICRNCNMRFFIVSRLHKIGYKYYPLVRPLRDLYLRFKRTLKKRI